MPAGAGLLIPQLARSCYTHPRISPIGLESMKRLTYGRIWNFGFHQRDTADVRPLFDVGFWIHPHVGLWSHCDCGGGLVGSPEGPGWLV